MKKTLLLFILLSSIVFPISYQYNGGNFTIDDKKIEQLFITSINSFFQQYGAFMDEVELKVLSFNTLLEEEVLLNSSYGKKITIPKKDIENRIAIARSQFVDEASFQKELKAQGYTMISLPKEIEKVIKLEKVKIAIEAQVKVTEEEGMAYFKKYKYNDYYINKNYDLVKKDIKDSILTRKKEEALRYFLESEKEKVILEKNSKYTKYYPQIVYEKEGFKFTNVDLANKKIMLRIQGISDEELLTKIVMEEIDNELKFVQAGKKLKLKISDNLAKEDKILAYADAYYTNIFNLINTNDLGILEKILVEDKNLILDYRPFFAKSILDYAIITNKLDVIKLFINHGIPFEDGSSSYSALEKAIENQNYDILDYLISKGASFDFINSEGVSLLDKAYNMNEKLAEYLITKGAIPKKIGNWETLKMVDEFDDPTGEIAIIINSENDEGWLRIRKDIEEVEVKVLDENNNELLDEDELPLYKKENKVIYKVSMHYDDYLAGKGIDDTTNVKIKNEKNELSRTFMGYVWDSSANNLSLYDGEVDEFIEFLKKSTTVKIAASDYNDSFHNQTFNVEKLEMALDLIKLP